MHFDGLCRRLGAVDPKPLADAIDALGEDAWGEYQKRQQQFKVHSATETIPLLFDEDSRHTDPTEWPRLAALEPALRPALDLIRGDYPPVSDKPGYFVRIILTRLVPGGAIPRHRDGGESLARSHRHHLAVTTNPLVEFYVGDRKHHFAAGEIWEINNRQPHEVRNLSEQGRVHLIADYVVPGERIDDPAGTVYA
ncbi:MAG TPA: aspartyl/asparaginyl beta-hydroxylase domain-containing protein [Sphingomicrobium sp.]|jgi:quercetin dioxygenase-like cupin family protein